MRGNLSGKQDLKYAENDNPAFEAPAGEVNYARNYQPRFIGAKRAKDGLKYFAVKTKSATHLTAKAMQQMALMGGTGAIVGAIFADKTSALYGELYGRWFEANTAGYTGSFRKFLSDAIMPRLKAKAEFIYVVYGPGTASVINNPWMNEQQTVGAVISDEILAKFWNILSTDAISFTVDGEKGLAHTGDAFSDVLPTSYNVLGLTVREYAGQNYIAKNNLYLYRLVSGQKNYVTEDSPVLNNGEYFTTSEQPGA